MSANTYFGQYLGQPALQTSVAQIAIGSRSKEHCNLDAFDFDVLQWLQAMSHWMQSSLYTLRPSQRSGRAPRKCSRDGCDLQTLLTLRQKYGILGKMTLLGVFRHNIPNMDDKDSNDNETQDHHWTPAVAKMKKRTWILVLNWSYTSFNLRKGPHGVLVSCPTAKEIKGSASSTVSQVKNKPKAQRRILRICWTFQTIVRFWVSTLDFRRSDNSSHHKPSGRSKRGVGVEILARECPNLSTNLFETFPNGIEIVVGEMILIIAASAAKTGSFDGLLISCSHFVIDASGKHGAEQNCLHVWRRAGNLYIVWSWARRGQWWTTTWTKTKWKYPSCEVSSDGRTALNNFEKLEPTSRKLSTKNTPPEVRVLPSTPSVWIAGTEKVQF
jgi:hypothetical protein